MAKLRTEVNRFFYRNRDRGIRNLMLYIAVGNVVVYFLYLLNTSDPLFYRILVFDPAQVLRGQLWRLLSYPLVYMTERGVLWGVLGLLFLCWCGRVLEQLWGVLRLNLYYFGAVLVTALAGLLAQSSVSAHYINLSLFLITAALQPDEMIRIYFIIPVKMKWVALFCIAYNLFFAVRGLVFMFTTLGSGRPYLGWLIPLVPILFFLLFFGKGAAAILPDFVRYHPTRKSFNRKLKQGNLYSSDNVRAQPRFRCTVCGRTELSNPGLEFRYCSKCAGYRCYCADHISNHTHITTP